MPRLSIVVPFLGNTKLLEDTLVSVLENRPEACQILVVLNEGYDDPYDLHGEVSFVASRPDAGLVGGIYRGLAACEAPIVHVLACGMEVSPGWTEAALSHFDDPQVGAVAPLVLQAAWPDRVVSAGVAYHRNGRVQYLSAGRSASRPIRCRRPLGPDARSAFYRRTALLALDGWNGRAAFGLTGIDLALAIQQQGLQCELEPACHTFAKPALIGERGAFRTGMEEARVFWRWASRQGRTGSVASHAALLLREGLGGLLWPPIALRMTGRLVGGLMAVGGGHGKPTAPAAASVIPGPHYRRLGSPRQPLATKASHGSSVSQLSDACSSGPAAPRRAPG